MSEELYVAVVSDALDAHGYRNQALCHKIRPLLPTTVVVGRALPVLCLETFEIPEHPYQEEIAAVDSLKQNDVLICSTNGSTRICFWGELLSTAARVRGARGAIIEGFIRDVRAIMDMGFPIFTTGISPVDSNGRGEVVAYNVPIECGGVTVNPGDIVFGDADGVVIIPQSVENQVIEAALEKVKGENRTRDSLLDGATLRQVYDEFGIL
ncbi:RraA family protein [Candidatus Poribacteria bacterium]|nr:RraA family protein [Candidatus Poribacteria bacterium]